VQISSRVRHAHGPSVTAAPASHSSARGVANCGSTNRRPTGSRCARMRRGRTAAALQTRRERAETTVRREQFDCRVNASRRSQLTARNRAATVYHTAASNVDCIRAGQSRDPVTWCGHVVRVSTRRCVCVCVCVSVDNCLPVRGVVASGGVN